MIVDMIDLDIIFNVMSTSIPTLSIDTNLPTQ